jgi:CheY-like chemotaxis protein
LTGREIRLSWVQVSDQALFLLVEDDSNDASLLRRAFSKAKVMNPLYVVQSAEEAIAYLKRKGRYSNLAEYPLPALILLDIGLPGISGHDFLRWIRSEPEFRGLRVVMLSGSDNPRDVNEAYAAGANSFLFKPADFDYFVQISQALNGYWMWLDRPPEIHGDRGERGEVPGNSEKFES